MSDLITLVTKPERDEAERKEALESQHVAAVEALDQLEHVNNMHGIRSFVFIVVRDDGIYHMKASLTPNDGPAMIGVLETAKQKLVVQEIDALENAK